MVICYGLKILQLAAWYHSESQLLRVCFDVELYYLFYDLVHDLVVDFG